MVKGSAAERFDDLVKTRTDTRHLCAADPRCNAHRFDEVIDATGRDSLHIRFHHDGVEGLADTPARLEDLREERFLAQLGDSQLNVTRLGGKPSIPIPVAFRAPIIGPFPLPSPDHFGGFGLDQFLENHADRLADKVHVGLTEADRWSLRIRPDRPENE